MNQRLAQAQREHPTTAPCGVNRRQFAEAVRLFEAVVGAEWVLSRHADLESYRDPFSPLRTEADERVASAAVLPSTVEQVQKVLRIANRLAIPMYAVSTGMNLGYGGASPNYSGSVVLDLSRMNRVIDVDDRRHFAVVEPGVTYCDLHQYITERGLNVWIDVPDFGWGSLVGNALDRGAGYSAAAYRNHFEAHCGMEVVLANGEVMRTGMGAVPGSATWQDYRAGFGPSVDGLFAQGNYGVVTKMGFWLMPSPPAYLSGTVSVPRHDDFIRLVEELTYLENLGVVNGMPKLGSPLTGFAADRTAELTRLLSSPDPSIPALERYGLQHDRPFWSCRLQFYGPPKSIAANWEYAKERFAAIPGCRFADGPAYDLPLTAHQLEQVKKATFGVPQRPTVPPSDPLIWFSPVVPRTGEAVFEAQRVLYAVARELGLPASRFVLPECFWTRAFIFVLGLPVGRSAHTNARLRESFRTLVRIAAEHGWAEYRAAPIYQDDVMNAFSFNDHALRRFCETIKDAVDPNGILSAGRSGIWPKRLRDLRASRGEGATTSTGCLDQEEGQI